MKVKKTISKNGMSYFNDVMLIGNSYEGNLDAVKFYLFKGVDVNATDSHGNTALHMACYRNHLDVVKELVNSGANVNAKNKAGFKARKIALDNKNPDIALYLIRQKTLNE